MLTVVRVVGWVLLAGLLGSCFPDIDPDDPLVDAGFFCSPTDATLTMSLGFDPNKPDHSRLNALFASATSSDSGGHCIETMVVLLDGGADASRLGEFGDSILAYVAVKDTLPVVVDLLVDAGADPCVPMTQDYRDRFLARDLVGLAENFGNPEVAAALRRVTERCPN